MIASSSSGSSSRPHALWSTFVVVAMVLVALPVSAQPANDQCAGAEIVPGGGPFPYLTAETDITDASTTGDPSSSTCADLPSLSRSVWYKLVPATTALYTISSCQDAPTGTTVPDTVIGVYTGTCGGSYSQVANGCDGDSCGALDFQAIVRDVQLYSGTTYWIVVWKYGAEVPDPSQSTVQLQITQSLTPSNDTCQSPTILPPSGVASGTNSLASLDYSIASLSDLCYPGVGQSTPYSSAPGPDTVWSYWPSVPGYYSFRAQVTQGSGNLVLYVTSGNCPPAGAGPFGCSTGMGVANRNTLSSNWVSAEEVFCRSFASTLPIFIFVDQAETYQNITGFTVEVSPCVKETEPNDSPAAAGALACGMGGSIGVAGDKDFFSLGTQPAGSRVFAIADGVPAGPNNRFDLRVTTTADTLEYDTSNNSPAFGDFSSNVAGTRLTGVASFLRINYNGDATAAEPYRLHAVVQPPGAGVHGTSATPESEPNNSAATANAAGSMFFSGSTTASDSDLYRFCAAEGDVIFLSMDSSPARNGVAFNPAVFLYDDHGGKLIDADYSLGGIYYRDDTAYTASTTGGGGSLTATTPYSPGEAATWRARYTGAYHVGARGGTSGGGSNGDYLLSIAVNCQTGGQQSAALYAAVTEDQEPVVPGATVTYWITVQNEGPNIALDAVLSNPIPAGTTFLSLTPAPGWTCTTPEVGAGGTVTCTTPCFAPGFAYFTLQVRVDNCLALGTEIVNIATPSSKTAGTSVPGSQTTLVSCDDGNTCTDDACDPGGGCQYTHATGPCDDGWECTVDDTCADGGCYGTLLPVPEEVPGLLVSRAGTVATVSWSPGTGADWYDVLRGPVAILPVGSNYESETCMARDLAATSVEDAEPTPPGAAYWYLVRGESNCWTGTFGFAAYHGTPTTQRYSIACP